MYPLPIVRPNNHIRQRCAALEDKHGVRVASLSLALACGWAAVVLVHATIEAETRRDCLDSGVGRCTRRLWKTGLQVGICRSREHHGGCGTENEENFAGHGG